MTHSLIFPDFEDKSKMLDILHNVIREDDHSLYYYKPDWSDLRVAHTVNPRFKAYHAATIRRAKFGMLAHSIPAQAPPPSRMDILEARVSRIIDILASNSPRSAQHRRYLLDGSSSTAHLDDI